MSLRPGTIARGLLRRAVQLPLKLASDGIRTQILEEFFASSFTTTALPGGSATFFTPTRLLRDRARTVLQKEPDMIRWLDSFANDDVLWDIGANVGVFSLYAGVTRKIRTLSFEPSAANFYVLSRNISLNGLQDRVTAYCLAFAGSTELGSLNGGSEILGGAMSQFGKSGEMSRYWTGGGGTSHGMIGFTVDEFIERFQPPFPTRIKMDVDGLEWPILQGASRTLADRRIRSAMIELSLSDKEERSRAMEFLARAGLRFVEHGEPQGSGNEWAANHKFVRD